MSNDIEERLKLPNTQRLSQQVIEHVREHYRENHDKVLMDSDIDALTIEEILSAYLSWEGIIGYDRIILNIFGYYGKY